MTQVSNAWLKDVTFKYIALLTTTALALYSSVLTAAPLGTAPELAPPLGVAQTGKPLVMLVAAKDHKLFYEAYNDASDINGDGNLDIRFDPSITYFGLFDSKVCYTHNNSGTNTGLFSPNSLSSDTVTYKCPGKWSGNWLNYITTSRIDALRKVLYGGFREIDTATETILRRAYIPQDTHAWAKEYTSTAVDGYNISDYTPLSQPSGSGTRRHFFGNTTMSAGTSCTTANDCSVNLPPLMSVVQNSTIRVWDWVSKQAPVMDASHGGTRTDYAVRVAVCTGTFLSDCQQYGSNSFKPVGLLHDFGENEAMLFGLLSGSYNKNMSGGVLRKAVSSFKDEVNQSTGQFTVNATIVQNFNALRIRDFNNTKNNASYRNGSFRTATMPEGDYVDWGNPVGEMMYESLRYFAGAKAPTSAFDTSGSHDAAIGLSRVATWDNPYESTSAAKAVWCARPNMLVMSDTYPSYDGDQVPGSPYASITADAKINTFNAKTLLDNISQYEPGVIGERFAGQTNATNLDYAPSAKTVSSLASVRGLAPEEPSKLGSYTSAAVAHYGKKTGIVTAAASGTTPEKRVEMDSYFVTFGSHVPSLDILVNGRTVRVVPFSKTIDGASTNRNKGQYQPTDPIVDLYVRSIANTNAKNANASVNSGRPYMQYNIIYEADEQGNDFDQDINSLYTLSVNEKNEVVVQVQIIDESTGSNQNVGYVISGTNRDGIYLVASDKLEALPYFLNTPPGQKPGYCDPVPASGTTRYNDCAQLPYLVSKTNLTPTNLNTSTETFTTSTNPGASFLKDPFWYGAKWGSFIDRNGNGRPDLQVEWDLDKDGVPDSYFLVQNPIKLKDSLRKAFNNIYARSAAAGNIAANSTSFTSETAVYQSVFNSGDWSGDLIAYPVTQNGVGVTPLWRASTKIPSATDRRMFTRAGMSGSIFNTSLDAATQALIDPVSTTRDSTINYLRGERSGEIQNGGSLRNRASSVLGDIVNSSPYYQKEVDTVFVGSNAGMLHAFNAKTGVERFAFIPSAALPHLKGLTQTSYQHRFLVDGEIVVTSKNQTPNKNLLFGFMGRGAKGLFALDVTNPDTFATTNVLWEIDGSDNDIGYLLGRPLVAKVKTGNNSESTVLIFGNGYNSTSGQAVLYVYNTDGSLLRKLSTGVGNTTNPNGMATPFLVTDNSGFVTSAYAGDLQGNVWKFNLSQTNSNQWDFSLKQGSAPMPLFTAKDANGKAQPITAPITSYINNVTGDTHFGKRYVFFGTGKYLASEDPNNKDTQTLYGLIDEGVAITGRTQLKQRTINNTGTFAGNNVRTFSQVVANDMVGKKGWYLDWLIPPSGTQEGERVVSSAQLISAFRPVLVVSSIIPIVDPCIPGGGGYLNALNPFSGGSVTTSTDVEGIFDVDGKDGFKNDKLAGEFISSLSPNIGLLGECALIGNRLICGGSEAKIIDPEINMGKQSERKRISWREIVR